MARLAARAFIGPQVTPTRPSRPMAAVSIIRSSSRMVISDTTPLIGNQTSSTASPASYSI